MTLTGSPRTKQAHWGRRKGTPGWVWGVVLLAGFVVLISSTWRYDSRDITIDAWACTATPSAEASWDALLEAGCSSSAVDAQIEIYQGVAPLAGATGADPVTIAGVDSDAIDLNLQLRLQDPASAVVLVDTSVDPPVPAVSMHGDSAGVRWNSPFDPARSTDFTLLIGPPPD